MDADRNHHAAGRGRTNALGNLHAAKRKPAGGAGAVPVPGQRVFLHIGSLQRSRRSDFRRGCWNSGLQRLGVPEFGERAAGNECYQHGHSHESERIQFGYNAECVRTAERRDGGVLYQPGHASGEQQRDVNLDVYGLFHGDDRHQYRDGDGNLGNDYTYNNNCAYDQAPSTQLIQNGGFETGTLANWTTGGAALPTISTVQKHSGSFSALAGASSGSEPNGDDFLYQSITIPSTATKATLTFWYWPSTTDTITYDWQEAQVQNTSGTMLAQIMKVCSNAQAWTQVTYDLTSYKGQTIRIYFNDHQDGFGDLTYMYLDDISVNVQ